MESAFTALIKHLGFDLRKIQIDAISAATHEHVNIKKHDWHSQFDSHSVTENKTVNFLK